METKRGEWKVGFSVRREGMDGPEGHLFAWGGGGWGARRRKLAPLDFSLSLFFPLPLLLRLQ